MARKPMYDTSQYIKKLRKMKGSEKSKSFMSSEKLTFGIQLLKKGDDYGEPAHKNGEFYFILKGRAKLSIGKNVFDVRPGMAMWVPPAKFHKFYDPRGEFVFLFIFTGSDAPAKKGHY